MPTVTFISQPYVLTPVYDLSYINAESASSTEPLFNFIFDVYSGYGISNFTRVIVPPSPDGSVYFSPFSILKDYIGYDLVYDLTGWTSSQCCAMNWKVEAGVQYAVNPLTGITQYPNLLSCSGYSWNAAMRYEQFANNIYGPGEWMPTSNASNFLTNMPDEVYIQNNEMASISLIGLNPINLSDSVGIMQVTVYQNSGGTTQYNVFTSNSNYNVSFPGNVVCHFGSGIWNLNQLTTGDTTVLTGAYPIFNPNTDYKYTVQAQYYYTLSGTPHSGFITKPQTYILDTTQRQQYNPVRLMWLNPLGGFDYFSFKLVSRLNTNVTRNTYKQNLGPQYNLGDRGTVATYNDIQEGMIINSDWVADNYSYWLEELFNSPEVYMLNPDGTIYPIILTDTQTEVKRYINDQTLVNYTLTFNFAYKVNVQQGSYIRSYTNSYAQAFGGPHNSPAAYKDRGGFPINIQNSPF